MTSAWDPIAQPIDYVLVAGQRTPGLCDVQNAGSPRQWDERRGYGLSGASLVFRGIGLASFTLRIRLYSEQDWTDWHAFAPVVQRPPTGERATALDVVHPILEEVGIRSAVVEDLLAPAQGEDGEWTIEIRMKEFRGRPEVTVAPVEGSAVRVESNHVIQQEARVAALEGQLRSEIVAGGATP